MKNNRKRMVLSQPWSILSDIADEILLKAMDVEEIVIGYERFAPKYQMAGSVAVIPVKGTIVKSPDLSDLFDQFTSMAEIREMLDAAVGDPGVSGVVFHIDSPGGQASGMKELADHVYEIRQSTAKPIIAYGDGLMCSGAFWLASQADTVAISSGTVAGSMGVIAITADYSQALEKNGIKAFVHKSGSVKGAGGIVGGHSEEQVRSIQAQVMKIAEIFKSSVQRGRDLSDEQIEKLSDAHTSLGEDAVREGMADEIVESFDELLARYQLSTT